MTLPTTDDIDRVLSERPGDDLYPEVRDQVDAVDEQEKEVKEGLVAIILKDLVLDAALANSCDEVGKILTYLSQKWQVEPAEFIGDIMMRNFSRLSKLKLSLDYAKLIGLEGDVLDMAIKAEVERLWQGDANASLLKKLLVNKAVSTSQTLAQPVETGVKAKER